jgi:hypothetical protein
MGSGRESPAGNGTLVTEWSLAEMTEMVPDARSATTTFPPPRGAASTSPQDRHTAIAETTASAVTLIVSFLLMMTSAELLRVGGVDRPPWIGSDRCDLEGSDTSATLRGLAPTVATMSLVWT